MTFSNSRSLPEITRRKLLASAASAAPLLAVPALAVASPTIPEDPIEECKRLAHELCEAMNRVRVGSYKINIDHQYGFTLIVDQAFRNEQEGPLVGTEAYTAWDAQRKNRASLFGGSSHG